MYKQASHRQLKNRTQKRRVTAHHYSPHKHHCDNGEYATLRANQAALTKLKHKPELIVKVISNLKSRQREMPEDLHLQKWQKLLNDLVEGQCTIDKIFDKVMGYDEQARQLRDTAILECLLD